MQQKALELWQSNLERWNRLEKGQKIRLVVTVLVLLVSLIFAIYLITRPNMVPLAVNQKPQDIAQIQAALKEMGIHSELADNGRSINVPDKDLSQSQVSLAAQNIPATTGFTWANALEASGMGTTDMIKRENIRRSLEDDLARKLIVFEGVDDAKVTLNQLKEDNFFNDTSQDASVGVVLTTNSQINSQQAMSIARQISRSVKGLKLENIEITDQNMNPLFSGYEDLATGTKGDDAYELELQRKRDLEKNIRSILSPMYSDVRVISNISLNLDKTVRKDTTLTPPVADSQIGVILLEKLQSSSATNATNEGEPGLAPNTQNAPTYVTGTPTGGTANSKTSDTTYGYNTRETQTEISRGTLIPEESSLFVVLYQNRIYNERYMTDNNLLNGARWEDFKVTQTQTATTTPLTIDQGLIDSIRTGTGIPNLAVTGYELPIFVDDIQPPLQIGQIVMFAILALLILLLAFGLIKKTKADEITEIEPELSVEDMLVSTQMEEEKEEEMRLAEINLIQESQTLQQIEKFVQDKPEAVASLLRNWLNEEWE